MHHVKQSTMPVIKKGELAPPVEKQHGVFVRKGELGAPRTEKSQGYEPEDSDNLKKFKPRTVRK